MRQKYVLIIKILIKLLLLTQITPIGKFLNSKTYTVSLNTFISTFSGFFSSFYTSILQMLDDRSTSVKITLHWGVLFLLYVKVILLLDPLHLFIPQEEKFNEYKQCFISHDLFHMSLMVTWWCWIHNSLNIPHSVPSVQ